MKYILAKKIEMTQMSIKMGKSSVTLVLAGPCEILQLKTKDMMDMKLCK